MKGYKGIISKLPNVGTNIFTIMSRMALQFEAINLAQGFPDFDCDPQLVQLVKKYMDMGKNQYAPMPGVPELRKAIADKISKLYDYPIDQDREITVTAGATQALFTAISALVHSGDEVIIVEPAYDCYKPAIELNGGVVIPYELQSPEFKIAWSEFETKITAKTRLIMVNNPHNPSGSVFSKEDLKQLQRIAVDHDLIVISDEVYEHLVFDGGQHESVVKYPELYARSLATYSFGKTFHNTGWKMGYCVGPPELMEEFRKVHQFNVFSVNTPIQYALAEYLQEPSHYLGLPDQFQGMRDLFLEKMQRSRFVPIPCEGTYFQLFDYSNISEESDRQFAERITREQGVASIPISVFYSSGRDEKVIRLCFAKTTPVLLGAADKLCEV